MMRLEVELRAVPIRSVDIWIVGLGHYELRLNGQKVGDAELGGSWTNYNKTCIYTHHVIDPTLVRVIVPSGMKERHDDTLMI